jgi:hypothetical protein
VAAEAFYCNAPARRAAIRFVLGSEEPQTGEMRSAPLFDRAELDSLLHRASEEDFAETTILGRVLTVELALRAVDAGL